MSFFSQVVTPSVKVVILVMTLYYLGLWEGLLLLFVIYFVL